MTFKQQRSRLMETLSSLLPWRKSCSDSRPKNPAAILPPEWFHLRQGQPEESSPAHLKAEAEAYRSLLESSGWPYLLARMEETAGAVAEGLISLGWRDDDDANSYLMRVCQYQNTIATMRLVSEIPKQVIVEYEESKEKERKVNGRRV